MDEIRNQKGLVKIEFIALRKEIQEKLDQGWSNARIWRLLRSEKKYLGSISHFNFQVNKYLVKIHEKSKEIDSEEKSNGEAFGESLNDYVCQKKWRIHRSEIIAQCSFIQEKLDQGWPRSHIWRVLWSEAKFTGSKLLFVKIVTEYFSLKQEEKEDEEFIN